MARAVARPLGVILVGLGVAMLVCGAVGPVLQLVSPLDTDLERGSLWPMLASAIVTTGCGIGLMAAGQRGELHRREAALAVAAIWFGAAAFGALPFILGAGLAPHDAFFEAASGFTTTGATILADIEQTLSRPLVLWRSLTQWLGGMGIVVLFVAIFPEIGVGGKHLYRSEAPGPTADGLRPRIAETSLVLWRLYLGFSVALAVILAVLGMPVFEAICHSMTAMSTGGFSPKNASIGHYDSVAFEVVLSVFMLIAGVNFSLYYGMLRTRSFRGFWRSSEFKAYLGITVASVVTLTVLILPNHDYNPLQSARYALFSTSTFITSTGFGTDDYMQYSGPALTIILLVMFIGGSAGSTAGGIKVSRFVLALKSAWGQVRRSFRPSVMHIVRMDGRAVPDNVVADVAAFNVVFMVGIALGVLIVTLTDGVSPQTAFGAVLSCVSNMGPAPYHTDAGDHFAPYSLVAKAIFSVAMILGRLEFFTLLALLLPDFWRR